MFNRKNREDCAIKSEHCHCGHMENEFESVVDLIQEMKREINQKLKHMEVTMAQNMADVQAAITAVDGKVDEVAGKIGDIAFKLSDLSMDFDAAIKKLREAISADTDTAPAVEALGALGTKLSSASEALTAASDSLAEIDVKAETISGNPTP